MKKFDSQEAYHLHSVIFIHDCRDESGDSVGKGQVQLVNCGQGFYGACLNCAEPFTATPAEIADLVATFA